MTSVEMVRSNLERWGLLDTAKAVAKEHLVPLDRMLDLRVKMPRACEARRRLWTLIRHTLAWSYPEIASLWGADHTSIMSGVKKCEARLEAQYAPRRTA